MTHKLDQDNLTMRKMLTANLALVQYVNFGVISIDSLVSNWTNEVLEKTNLTPLQVKVVTLFLPLLVYTFQC